MRTSKIPPLFNHVFFFFFLLSIGSSSSWQRQLASHTTTMGDGTTLYWKGDVKNVAVQSAHVHYITRPIYVLSFNFESKEWKKTKKNCYSAIESIDIMHLAQTLIGLPFVPGTLAQTFFLSLSSKKYRVPRLLAASNDSVLVYLVHFPLSARLNDKHLIRYVYISRCCILSVSVLYLMT